MVNRKRLSAMIAGLLLGPAACGDLEENPTDFLAPENFYTTAADAITAVNGVYSNLYGQSGISGWRQWVMTEYPGPALTAKNPDKAREAFDQYTWNPTTGYLGPAYEDAYQAITRANAVLKNVPRIQMDEALKNRVLGEARFLRALYYFNLVRYFGGVPLLTELVTDFRDVAKPRASADEVYKLIVEDLKFAEQHLPDSYPASDYGRATRGAAQMLLGKVYLTRGVVGGTYSGYPAKVSSDLGDAIAQFRKVIQGGRYSLVPNYAMLFNEATERNSEVIFPIVHIEQAGMGGNTQNYQALAGTNWGSGQWIHQNTETPFYLSYNPADMRRDVSWIAEYVDRKGVHHKWDPDPGKSTHLRAAPSSGKFIIRRPLTALDAGPLDYPYMRYADVLLLLAEAINEQNKGPNAEAYGAIDAVRARAGLPPLPTGLGYEAFRERVFEERLWELTQEFHYYFDAQRFWDLNIKVNRAHQAVKSAYPATAIPPTLELEETDRLFPIPTSVMDKNAALTQNPGY